jgi:hypothetical protein
VNQNSSSKVEIKKKIGKVRGAGELARRKSRVSSLKKGILQERRARFYLDHPDAMPVPLKVHPALMQFNCVWVQEEEKQVSEVGKGWLIN